MPDRDVMLKVELFIGCVDKLELNSRTNDIARGLTACMQVAKQDG